MAKKAAKTIKRQTNWTVIFIVAGVGIVGLFLLLALTLTPQEVLPLADYCQQNSDRCITKGEASAPVTIVEVFDYGCTHCRDFDQETFAQLDSEYITTGKVRWISLPYALRSETIPAASASMCANEQDAYFEFTHAMFSNFDASDYLSKSSFMTVAIALGLDTQTFETCMDEGRYDEIVQQNMDAASSVGANSTPTFYINGSPLRGAYPFATFQEQIEGLIQ